MNYIHNNINIYLLKKSSSFDKYLDVRANIIERKNINKSLFNQKSDFITSGKIFVFERLLTQPNWLNVINIIKLNNTKISLDQRKDYASVVFLETSISYTIALAFGKLEGLLLPDFIVPNFGLTVAKYFIETHHLKSISLQSFDSEFTKTNKSSPTALNSAKLLPPSEINIINAFQGKTNINGVKINLNGNDSLKITGKISIPSDLIDILQIILNTYDSRETLEMKFKLTDSIKQVSDMILIQKLNKLLENKLLRIFSSASKLNNNTLKNFSFAPEFTIPQDQIIGYKISGIGIPTSKTFEEVDLVHMFEKIQLRLPKDPDYQIIHKKLNNMKVKAIVEDSQVEFSTSFFKSLFYELTHSGKNYFLYQGNWYEVLSNFYQQITEVIDNINTEQALDYFKYESKSKQTPHGFNSENEYNAKLISKVKKLSLDCTKFKPNAAVRDSIDLHHSSNIEIADILNTSINNLQFIHIKRKTKNSGAAQTIHLFSQAKASAQLYLHDKSNVQEFINEQISLSNKKNSFKLETLDFTKPYNLQIVLGIITPKKVTKISKLFTLLERISLYETCNFLNSVGFELIINIIESD